MPDWINHVHELFPKRTIERLEKDALERYQLDEMVTNADVLSRAQPNPTLLKAVLRTKHLMNQDVLKAAQHLARQVVEELMKKLAQDVKNAVPRGPRSPPPLAPQDRQEPRPEDHAPPQPQALRPRAPPAGDRIADLLLPRAAARRSLADHHPRR